MGRRWDSVHTLGVRELETSFLECSLWNADELIGEAILQLSPLSEAPWDVVEKHLPLQALEATQCDEECSVQTTKKDQSQEHGQAPGSIHLAVCWLPMSAASSMDNLRTTLS